MRCPNNCMAEAVSNDLQMIADGAAELAFRTFDEKALDDHVIISAIHQVLVNLGDIPPGLKADLRTRTRAAIERKARRR
jgi:hypothetical protein